MLLAVIEFCSDMRVYRARVIRAHFNSCVCAVYAFRIGSAELDSSEFQIELVEKDTVCARAYECAMW